jgi:hypothetical protein
LLGMNGQYSSVMASHVHSVPPSDATPLDDTPGFSPRDSGI